MNKSPQKNKPAKQSVKKGTEPVGRPTDYQPEFCQQLIEHMTKGYSFESFAGIVSVARRTLYLWADAHEEFMHAKDIGQGKCQVTWESIGIEGIWNEEGQRTLNIGIWVFNMKNRFGWTDKREIVETSVQTVKVQALTAEDMKEITKKDPLVDTQE